MVTATTSKVSGSLKASLGNMADLLEVWAHLRGHLGPGKPSWVVLITHTSDRALVFLLRRELWVLNQGRLE